MEGLQNAYILRVNKRTAGKDIPFDKIYLFHKSDQELFPRIFANAMVFPVNTGFSNQLQSVMGTSPNRQLRPFTRFGADELEKKIEEEKPWDNFYTKRHDYLALIPVLFTKNGAKQIHAQRFKGRKKVATFAAYLVARPGIKRVVGLVKKINSTRAYFLVDGKKVQPLCLCCPKHQASMQGECHLGQVECFQHLARSKPADMVRGMALYEAIMKKLTEPPLELEKGDTGS